MSEHLALNWVCFALRESLVVGRWSLVVSNKEVGGFPSFWKLGLIGFELGLFFPRLPSVPLS